RKNFSHQASSQVVKSAKLIIGLEDLNLKGMTKRAKPKQDGRQFVKNKARAKSGLSRSLLNVALGRLGDYIEYKAVDYGKATVRVSAAYSSKTHYACRSRDTVRPNQATLICRRCGAEENADENAAKVVAQRTVTYIKENAFADKAKSRKTIVRRKKKVDDPPLVCELASG
ncbi:MAG: zinc ribbon domain-containing protein, partial [Pseudomonadales bacterium]|nr:zinc ribbon domain-containing protein [Pseudomonadales bacterium]